MSEKKKENIITLEIDTKAFETLKEMADVEGVSLDEYTSNILSEMLYDYIDARIAKERFLDGEDEMDRFDDAWERLSDL